MITEDKVTEIFCITDDFCKVFDVVSLYIQLFFSYYSPISDSYHNEDIYSFFLSSLSRHVCPQSKQKQFPFASRLK